MSTQFLAGRCILDEPTPLLCKTLCFDQSIGVGSIASSNTKPGLLFLQKSAGAGTFQAYASDQFLAAPTPFLMSFDLYVVNADHDFNIGVTTGGFAAGMLLRCIDPGGGRVFQLVTATATTAFATVLPVAARYFRATMEIIGTTYRCVLDDDTGLHEVVTDAGPVAAQAWITYADITDAAAASRTIPMLIRRLVSRPLGG